MSKGLIISAPSSGSGKTIVTLGIMRALKNRGVDIRPAKTGPDYIDSSYLAKAAGRKTLNLDSFAMGKNQLLGLASTYEGAGNKSDELLIVEGVMGLFDGAAVSRVTNVDHFPVGQGSSADLAIKMGLPVIIVVNCSSMAQSIGAIIYGFANFSKDINITGVILNLVGSKKHEMMLRDALLPLGIEVLGAIYRDDGLNIKSRHLGLILPNEIDDAEGLIIKAAKIVEKSLNLDRLIELSSSIKKAKPTSYLAPLGQHIAIAKDKAFAFIYEHFLLGWKEAGAQVSFFSPLANQAPDETADAVFLLGGYPELFGQELANADIFMAGLIKAKERDALIYGECGGFMVLGEALVDAKGVAHKMSGLLPITSTINKPKRVLGYRYLSHKSPLPWAENLVGHEFHYSSCSSNNLSPLFEATDAKGDKLPAMGAVNKNVMGSYAHVISAQQIKSAQLAYGEEKNEC